MDTSRFTHTDADFPLLDLTAKFAFKTSASISFNVGRIEDIHPDDEPDFVISAFVVKGWIDVHHPCEDCVKAQIRICLPVAYHQFAMMDAMVKTICEALSIPATEHCESTVFSSEHQTGILADVYFGTR